MRLAFITLSLITNKYNHYNVLLNEGIKGYIIVMYLVISVII